MHCDVNRQDSVKHLWQCIDEIAVDRIDHGVNSLDDPKLSAEIGRRGLALTVCPVSNAFVTEGTQAGAIRRMLDQGMRVTVNSDDPGYFGAYLEENLVVVQKEIGLSREDLKQLSRNAFEAAPGCPRLRKTTISVAWTHTPQPEAFSPPAPASVRSSRGSSGSSARVSACRPGRG